MGKTKEKKGKKNERPVSLGVKGMPDFLPKDEGWWKAIWQVGTSIAELHDFHYIETPLLERAEFFEKSLGKYSETLEKRMYAVKGKGSDLLVLRSCGTIPLIRSYIEHHLGYFASPLKVFYFGPMYRKGKPHSGEELHQVRRWGFEIVGNGDPIYDVEVILAALEFLRAFKLKDLSLRINSLGCKVCRGNYREKLRAYYQNNKDELCKTCVGKMDGNISNLFRCLETKCLETRKDVPIILDYLCQNCNNHLKTVLEIIEDNGILYEPDPYLGREFEYYGKTVFEIRHPALDAPLASGERYDYLSEILGGRLIPAVGARIAIEHVLEIFHKLEMRPPLKTKPKVFFVAVGEQAKKAGVKIMNELRAGGISVMEAVGKKSLRGQLKVAEKVKAPFTLLFGQKEVFEKTVIFRDMRSSAQESVILSSLLEEVKQRIKTL